MSPHLVGFVEIGAYLQEVRESLKVSREQAALALHVRPRYIEALEQGALDQLPGMAYARGYMRKYAEYLGLAPDEVMRAYDQAVGMRSELLGAPEPTRREARPGSAVLLISILALLLLMGAWRVLSPLAGTFLHWGNGAETAAVGIATPAELPSAPVRPWARDCLLLMPREAALACYRRPALPDWLGLVPTPRYASTLAFPAWPRDVP